MSDRSCVWIVVMGDLGQSPRMLRHAESFSRTGCRVELVGLEGREVPGSVANDPNVRQHRVVSMEGLRNHGLPFAVGRQLALGFLLSLRMLLLPRPRPRLVVVQNPPAIPLVMSLLTGVCIGRWNLWVDWHNTTRAMVEAGRGEGRLSRLAGLMESMIAGRERGNIAVSRALAKYLGGKGIEARVLRDLPCCAPRHSEETRTQLRHPW